ncbi:hypothetical protein QLL95_gp0651 [Cotonvirus japonicus]|uniref:Uncharacterized protein n=1 Tax=Cotonvirus japonicus TaxID=2811091 RepID=A0ABM7NTH0_9VIRU|nr:hypothetical protein QLL95_gp0651 [Cotonvirus japonicus]BCS83472.1 hypothetical protein [Cotonvirus japonicus]
MSCGKKIPKKHAGSKTSRCPRYPKNYKKDKNYFEEDSYETINGFTKKDDGEPVYYNKNHHYHKDPFGVSSDEEPFNVKMQEEIRRNIDKNFKNLNKQFGKSNFDPKFNPNLGPGFNPNFTSNLNPNFNSNFGPNLNANFGPNLNPNFGPGFGPNFSHNQNSESENSDTDSDSDSGSDECNTDDCSYHYKPTKTQHKIRRDKQELPKETYKNKENNLKNTDSKNNSKNTDSKNTDSKNNSKNTDLDKKQSDKKQSDKKHSDKKHYKNDKQNKSNCNNPFGLNIPIIPSNLPNVPNMPVPPIPPFLAPNNSFCDSKDSKQKYSKKNDNKNHKYRKSQDKNHKNNHCFGPNFNDPQNFNEKMFGQIFNNTPLNNQFNVPINNQFNVPVNNQFGIPFNNQFNNQFNVPFNVPFNNQSDHESGQNYPQNQFFNNFMPQFSGNPYDNTGCGQCNNWN